MNKRMNEQELLACFDDAVNFGHIFVTYQPKINHSTGRMIGAEALMRWSHPVYGMQYPSDFIPVLEKNDLIYKADLAVFESVCIFLRKCLNVNITPVPISVNMSRYDIYRKCCSSTFPSKSKVINAVVVCVEKYNPLMG